MKRALLVVAVLMCMASLVACTGNTTTPNPPKADTLPAQQVGKEVSSSKSSEVSSSKSSSK